MTKLIQEMYQILGYPDSSMKVPETKSIKYIEPREVVGSFIIGGITAMDEHILESVGELNWDQISDLALLSTVEQSDLQNLIMTYSEDSSEFRELWSAMVEHGVIDKTVSRGAFVLLHNLSPQTESQSKYINWCVKAIQESGEQTKLEALDKSSKFNGIIPSGTTDSQHTKSVDTANKYITPYTMDNDRPDDKNKVMHNDVIKNTPGQTASSIEIPAAKGMAVVKGLEKTMAKAAEKVGKDVESAFPNLWNMLGRERARHS